MRQTLQRALGLHGAIRRADMAAARRAVVSITLHGSEESIRLTVVDDGIGFNVAQVERHQAGIGLRNMRERVEHFGGRFELISMPGSSVLDVLLPMKTPGAKR